jgi:hypothetical protein
MQQPWSSSSRSRNISYSACNGDHVRVKDQPGGVLEQQPSCCDNFDGGREWRVKASAIRQSPRNGLPSLTSVTFWVCAEMKQGNMTQAAHELCKGPHGVLAEK